MLLKRPSQLFEKGSRLQSYEQASKDPHVIVRRICLLRNVSCCFVHPRGSISANDAMKRWEIYGYGFGLLSTVAIRYFKVGNTFSNYALP